MILTLYILLFSSLALVFTQDIKEREVSVLVLVFCLLSSTGLHYIKTQSSTFYLAIAFNALILGAIVLVLLTYTKFILKRKFNECIGLGDLVFFLCMALGFPTVTFLILFVSSLVFSLVFFKLIEYKLTSKLIPLAGFQALFLFLILATNVCFHFSNLYLI